MTTPRTSRAPAALAALALLLVAGPAAAADHNDPNAVNSIFADVPLSAADLYDFFGFPSADKRGGEKVVVALTFAPVPKTGVFDSDLLYRLLLDPDPRVVSLRDDHSLTALHMHARAVKRRFAALDPAEVRVKVRRPDRRAEVDFRGFPGGDFSKLLATNKVETVRSPGGHTIQVYIGGRDDAFFNDLPGFFRSINYAPQFYKVPQARTDRRELEIPKTLIELEGNALFNFDPKNPKLGEGVKEPLPRGEPTWQGDRFAKDRNGNYRFVYSGRDAQAGRNINAIILELPLAFVTRAPKTDRVVSAWGESWVLKAARKIEAIPDDGQNAHGRHESRDDPELQKYKLVDTDGVPFADAALNERADSRQLGANNQLLARDFVIRFAHLGWGFGPSVSALGLGTCFDHDDSPVSRVETYAGHPCLPAGQEVPVPGAQHAGRLLEPEEAPHPPEESGRDLHPQRLRHRHGHDRQLALRAAAGGPGGDALPLGLPRHEGGLRRQALHPGEPRQPGALEHREDRAQDAAQPAAQRQAVPRPLPLPGGPVVAGWAVAALAAVLAAVPPDGTAEPAATDYDRERAALAQRIGELEETADDPAAAARLAVQHYRYATLSGDFAELRAAEEAIERALAALGRRPTSASSARSSTPR